MGWRYQVGATRPCKVWDGKLYVDSKPQPMVFNTALPYNIDWQTNLFEGEGICFVLVYEEEQRIVIGQATGSIIIVDYSGTLTGITSWSPPTYGMEMQNMGYYSSTTGMYQAYASAHDPYYIHAGRRSLVLPEPIPRQMFNDDFDESGFGAESLSVVIQGSSIFASGPLNGSSGEWIKDPDRNQSPRLILNREV